MPPFCTYALSIPCPLCFIIDPDVLMRDLGCRSAVVFQESMDILHEDGIFKCMLENLDKRPIPGEEDRDVPAIGALLAGQLIL